MLQFHDFFISCTKEVTQHLRKRPASYGHFMATFCSRNPRWGCMWMKRESMCWPLTLSCITSNLAISPQLYYLTHECERQLEALKVFPVKRLPTGSTFQGVDALEVNTWLSWGNSWNVSKSESAKRNTHLLLCHKKKPVNWCILLPLWHDEAWSWPLSHLAHALGWPENISRALTWFVGKCTIYYIRLHQSMHT